MNKVTKNTTLSELKAIVASTPPNDGPPTRMVESIRQSLALEGYNLTLSQVLQAWFNLQEK